MNLFFIEENFESYINALKINLDRIPDPKLVTQETYQMLVIAHRTTARNSIGRWLLKRRFRRMSAVGPSAFLDNGRILEVYPFPK